jgi:hypothetical protein
MKLGTIRSVQYFGVSTGKICEIKLVFDATHLRQIMARSWPDHETIRRRAHQRAEYHTSEVQMPDIRNSIQI